MTVNPTSRVNVYIDGFNLYHACFDTRSPWRAYKWLDLGSWAANLFPGSTINQIRYFTALVDPTPINPDNRTRQLAYIRALETIPHLTVHQGYFATNTKTRYLADPSIRKSTPLIPIQAVRVVEAEEKGSDVNLASYLLIDAFRSDYDVAVVVSNDSDLAEPIRLVRSEFGLQVGLVNPRKDFAAKL